jgi:hypothetical protein
MFPLMVDSLERAYASKFLFANRPGSRITAERRCRWFHTTSPQSRGFLFCRPHNKGDLLIENTYEREKTRHSFITDDISPTSRSDGVKAGIKSGKKRMRCVSFLAAKTPPDSMTSALPCVFGLGWRFIIGLASSGISRSFTNLKQFDEES